MATGEVVGSVYRAMPPNIQSAHWSVFLGGSTFPESNIVLTFDDTSAEYMDWMFRLHSNYAGGGIRIAFVWRPDTATTGAVRWTMAIRRYNSLGEDTTASHTYSILNVINASTPGTLGQPSASSISLTDGSRMDNMVAGEVGILRMWRDPVNAADTMVGDAFLFPGLEITEG